MSAEEVIADGIHVCERGCINRWAGDHCVRRSAAVTEAGNVTKALRSAGYALVPTEALRELLSALSDYEAWNLGDSYEAIAACLEPA